MLRSISWPKFLEWMAYSEIEPFDERRADMRTASVCTVLANIHRNPKRRIKPFEINDFLLIFGGDVKPIKKQTWQEQKLIAQMWSTAANGPVKRNK